MRKRRLRGKDLKIKHLSKKCEQGKTNKRNETTPKNKTKQNKTPNSLKVTLWGIWALKFKTRTIKIRAD